jgi:hypothetical protein
MIMPGTQSKDQAAHSGPLIAMRIELTDGACALPQMLGELL